MQTPRPLLSECTGQYPLGRVNRRSRTRTERLIADNGNASFSTTDFITYVVCEVLPASAQTQLSEANLRVTPKMYAGVFWGGGGGGLFPGQTKSKGSHAMACPVIFPPSMEGASSNSQHGLAATTATFDHCRPTEPPEMSLCETGHASFSTLFCRPLLTGRASGVSHRRWVLEEAPMTH